VKAKIQEGPQATASAEFIQWVVETYRDDFNGFRADILNMKPEPWQDKVGAAVMKHRRVAVQSGHGIGKTAFCAAAIIWYLATRPHPAVVATANTEVQLNSKLWREVKKVADGSIIKDWFVWTATRFSLASDITATAMAIPWNENNPEAFAGTHEEYVLGVFDESSSIPEVIFTTFSGAMTTAGAKWLIVGNPTLNTGYFYEACNGRLKANDTEDERLGKWVAFTIGSPESSFVTKEWVEEQRATLREDEFRVRVLGLPPREAPDQFISPELVDEATRRTVQPYHRWPLVLGVDVARQGNDLSVIVPRRGLIVPDRIRSYHGLSLKQLAWKVAEEIRLWREEDELPPSAVFIEGGGSIGWGVIEELWELGFEIVHDVNPGQASAEKELYANKRCEMWGKMKDWLEQGGQIPVNGDLRADLIIPKRKPDPAMKLRLESKDEIRNRTRRSPDYADALALTFAAPVDLLPEKKRDSYRDLLYNDQTNSPTDWMVM
jgi:hypothetical protein